MLGEGGIQILKLQGDGIYMANKVVIAKNSNGKMI